MRRALRYALAAVGSAVMAVGLLLAVDPSMGSGVSVSGVVERLGNDYLLVVPLGALAVLSVLAVLAARTRSGVDQATPPDPEQVPTAPHPGSEVDRLADDGLGLRARLLSDDDEQVRERLRAAAIGTVMRSEGCSREEARDRVDSGEWTDDPAAASFLAGGADLSLRERVTAALRGKSAFQRGLHRTAAAIAVRPGDSVFADGGERDDDENDGGDRS
ncbi:hypothetical protein G9464_19880 [Halostella sp. JP-L12]|uniref:DUF7269 family protein n=1 Tax=Halostella TaxID=1843185 RepID=UPI0013CF00E4|nr:MULTISPECIES: hypothetical protein [Halostella]NHN49831.1 hypothetical protein [Halostella sp. JP-L12]